MDIQCQNCKNVFEVTEEDSRFYGRIQVPPPTWCPQCRMIRRMVFRNERQLFRRKDDASSREIFSEYPDAVRAKVYEHDYWWSDKWDAMDYGRDYDFSRPFFEQFRELMYVVPWPSREVTELVNSDYSNHGGFLKNCYLCSNIGHSENCAYVNEGENHKDCLDVTMSLNDELCYECMGMNKSYRAFFSHRSEQCRDVWFSRDLTGCSDCFGCVNLRSKQYYIFNSPCSKEDYFNKLRQFNLGSYGSLVALGQAAQGHSLRFPVKFMFSWHNVNVSGDYISSSRNAKKSFIVNLVEDVKYCQYLFWGGKDSYDFTNWGEAELMYEVFGSGLWCRDLKFTWDCWPANQELEYCIKCGSSNNLFGCVGLKKKSYCIFNKQYSRDDYFALREKIVRHMSEMPHTDGRGRVYRYGEFFPPEFSPFAYNETLAQDFFPLTKETAEAEGYLWRDQKTGEYQTTIDAKDLPDVIAEVGDSITKEIIKCISCSKAFRIVPMELEFYRKQSLPLPRLCVNCRFRERVKHRNPPRFYKRKCQCAGAKSDNGVYANQTTHFHNAGHCPNEFETSYSPERPEIVYCEACYQSEVV